MQLTGFDCTINELEVAFFLVLEIKFAFLREREFLSIKLSNQCLPGRLSLNLD